MNSGISSGQMYVIEKPPSQKYYTAVCDRDKTFDKNNVPEVYRLWMRPRHSITKLTNIQLQIAVIERQFYIKLWHRKNLNIWSASNLLIAVIRVWRSIFLVFQRYLINQHSNTQFIFDIFGSRHTLSPKTAQGGNPSGINCGQIMLLPASRQRWSPQSSRTIEASVPVAKNISLNPRTCAFVHLPLCKFFKHLL